jgi:ABC-type transporter MlaC component
MVPHTRLPLPPSRLLLATLLALSSLVALPGQAQSNLLESVRRDPSRAQRLCRELRQLNQQGISYTSKQALRQIASQENLSLMDAEVLTTYVVGLHCPDVR